MAVAMDNAILENILRQVRPLIGQGKVADYIPALATVDGSRLGIAICTVDGQLFQAGDAQERFSIQSISKVLSLVVAMRHYSEEEIWQRVGKDPSGSPFNFKHQLLSIALNGMTKFRTRILPQLLAGQKANGTLPARLTFALAALIAFYRGVRNGETYPVQDDAHWLERYQQLWSQYRDRVIGTQELVAIVLAEKDHWEQDLTQVPGLVEQVANDLDAILEKGMREAVRPLC